MRVFASGSDRIDRIERDDGVGWDGMGWDGVIRLYVRLCEGREERNMIAELITCPTSTRRNRNAFVCM